MHNQFHQPFERFVRKKMQALRKPPSNQLWERIATRQREIRRWGIFRQILIRSGILVGLLAGVIWGAGQWPEEPPKTAQETAQSFSTAPKNAHQLLDFGNTQTLSNYKEVVTTERQFTKQPTIGIKDKTPASVHPIPARKKQMPRKTGRKQPIGSGLENQVVEFISEESMSGTAPIAASQAQEVVDKKPWFDFQQLPSRLSTTVAFVKPESPFSIGNFSPPIKPLRETGLQYGLSFSGGKMDQLGSPGGHHFSIGIQLQYRLSPSFHLFGGLEWQEGQRNFNPIVIGGGIQAFPNIQFPHLPQLPPVPDGMFFNLLSGWKGISLPLGATICGKLPIRRTEWLARTYYKPYFAIKQENLLLAPLLSSLSDEVFEDKKAALKTGWAGVQAGLGYAVDKRWQLELTLTFEQALAPVNLERVNHQTFSLRLAILRR